MTTRAVLYARVSGDDRGKEGRNLAGQLEMGKEYAQERGYQVIAELAEDDRGASGAEIDLPELNKVRDMAQTDEFDVLVVREIDRLSRNLAKQLIVEQELQRSGVRIEYVIGEYPNTPEGRLNKHIRATIAEYEREKIAERMTRARRSIVRNGKIMLGGGHPPYGYRLSEDETNLVPYEPEARIVRLIFQWYVVGDEDGKRLSSVTIADRLSNMRVPTWSDIHGGPRKEGKKRGYGEWSPATVLRYLHKELYAGKWYYGKRPDKTSPKEHWIPLEVPALVSVEIWDAAQKQCKQNRIMSPRNNKYDYLMRYRLTCHRCGRSVGALTTQDGDKVYPYYVCFGRSNSNVSVDDKCELPYFRGDHVDPAVWAWVRDLLLDPRAMLRELREEQSNREDANRSLRERVAIVNDLLAENEEQLERVLDLYLTSDFPRAMLTERKERLQATIDTLEQERLHLMTRLEARTLKDEQIASVMEFTAKVGKGLEKAEQDLEKQRQMIDILDVEGILAVEDGEKVIHVRCIVDQSVLSIVPSDSNSARA